MGWGHFSTVWLAKDLYHDSFVAIKIQKSAQQYLEAAFDEVEILEQVSTKWKTKEWQDSFKSYEKNVEKVNSDSCYCIQLLNSFIHSGPNGKHFAMVFEILGVTLLEIIKRYNYKGVPLPLVRIITKQILIGLDYLHRICHIIHTDLKPENVLVCLTKEEVKEIIAQGQFGKARSNYKYGASPLPEMKGIDKEKSELNKKEVKKTNLNKAIEEMTEEERLEFKKQKKREKKKRLKKKKQEAKSKVNMNKENNAEKEEELEESVKEEVKIKSDDQPKVITNTMKEKLNINYSKRRLSDPTSSPTTTKGNWNDEDIRLESELTPDKKLVDEEEQRPFKDR